MTFITFLSDLGGKDHYVAGVKASIFKINPQAKIVDITHQIEPFNIAQAAYIFRSVYQDFPEGSIHLLAIDSTASAGEKFIIANINNHLVISTDNGLVSLLETEPSEVYLVDVGAGDPVFPEKNIMATICAKLSLNPDPAKLGKSYPSYLKKLLPQARFTKNNISGQVIHIDGYGNLISNINKVLFEKIAKDRKYRIHFSREQIERISTQYNQMDPGEAIVLFNSAGLLEIAINQGNASELLGLHVDSQISIFFNPEL